MQYKHFINRKWTLIRSYTCILSIENEHLLDHQMKSWPYQNESTLYNAQVKFRFVEKNRVDFWSWVGYECDSGKKASKYFFRNCECQSIRHSICKSRFVFCISSSCWCCWLLFGVLRSLEYIQARLEVPFFNHSCVADELSEVVFEVMNQCFDLLYSFKIMDREY